MLPLFFFNPKQAEANKNPYFGAASFQFLCQSLVDLRDAQLEGRLVCLRGSDEECLEQVISSQIDIRVLGFNVDFTPFARYRDERLLLWCKTRGIELITSTRDYTLLPLNAVETGTGGPYSVFTPFYRRMMSDFLPQVPRVQPGPSAAELRRSIWVAGPDRLRRHAVDPSAVQATLTSVPADMRDVGGRTEGLRLLRRVNQFTHYASERDKFAADRTTHWSPHLKFGTISVRECWEAVRGAYGTTHDLARQLIWREFYSMLLFHHPELAAGQIPLGETIVPAPVDDPSRRVPPKPAKQDHPSTARSVLLRNQPFQHKYATFVWKWDPEHFEAFKAGRTGVPLVDASVRCLTRSGWCPNRCRMVLANYLVKTLGVDWREGERWYATCAVDYDVANNSGGWLWSSGQGADAQPYFRTFNPFRQSATFDPECVFIRRWVPELAEAPAAIIHHWEELCQKADEAAGSRRGAGNSRNNGGKNTGGKDKAPSTKKTVGRREEETMEAVHVIRQRYPAPIVCTREATNRVIEAFKEFNNKVADD